ncbi:MAG: NFACT RNA binding domain-containing protein [Candidatus Micrarchaeota archaeon]|nr:NFACT RNA binding domain-containing protein [Candidatus Micrarchaeota archaeon]
MKLKLDFRKTAQENASAYYGLAKELASKEAGAKKAIEETKKEMESAGKEHELAVSSKVAPKMKRTKKWFEKYRWFYTSGEKLVVAGRDAKQNDMLVAKTMTDDDLFFHADIQGAPATILVGGKDATPQEKKEAAQFAASHSSAWKVGAAAVDVYAVKKMQLSKHAQGGFVGSGGFAISGEREWFRETPLGLAVGMQEGIIICLPQVHPGAQKLGAMLSLGNFEKGQAAKRVAGLLRANPDEILLALPSGKFSIKGRK